MTTLFDDVEVDKHLDMTMTWDQISLAANKAVDRLCNRRATGSRHKDAILGRDAIRWDADINGMIGEHGVAIHYRMSVDWRLYPRGTPPGDRPPDVGNCLNVRTITSDNLRLIVYPKEDERFPLILVELRLPVVRMRGWIWPKVAKDRAKGMRWQVGPLILVPPEHLEAMADLDVDSLKRWEKPSGA